MHRKDRQILSVLHIICPNHLALIRNAFNCPFLWKAAQGCCLKGAIRQSQAEGRSVLPVSLLCTLAEAPPSLSVRNCIWNENSLWQFSYKVITLVLTESVKEIENWCFPICHPWMSAWMRGRKTVEMQPLLAAMWDCVETVRPDPVGEEELAVWVSCSESIVRPGKIEARQAVWLVVSQFMHRKNQIMALYVHKTLEKHSQSVAGERDRNAVLSFASRFELRYKANVLNERSW